jgi:DNA-binding transcriptional LysR family regulator
MPSDSALDSAPRAVEEPEFLDVNMLSPVDFCESTTALVFIISDAYCIQVGFSMSTIILIVNQSAVFATAAFLDPALANVLVNFAPLSEDWPSWPSWPGLADTQAWLHRQSPAAGGRHPSEEGRMTLQQLETFFWTVNLGSFGAAAERLYTTQSTVSMRVRELEKTLGVELFDRSLRKAHLTPKGRELMDYAIRILDLSTEMEHRIAAPGSVVGSVRFGVAEMVSTTWLPELIKLIAKRYPHVRLEIEEALTRDLMYSLEHGEIELVLAPGYARVPNACTLSLGSVQFAWMASPALTLDLDNHVYSPSELSAWPVIALKPESFHSSAIEDWFRRDHARCHYLARCKSIAVAASMTIAGMGVSYLPVRSYQAEIAQGKLGIVGTTEPFEPVAFIAAFPQGHAYSLASGVAELAREVSDFDK